MAAAACSNSRCNDSEQVWQQVRAAALVPHLQPLGDKLKCAPFRDRELVTVSRRTGTAVTLQLLYSLCSFACAVCVHAYGIRSLDVLACWQWAFVASCSSLAYNVDG